MKKIWNLRNQLLRKQLAATISLVLVLICFVGTTLAYVIAKAGPVTNLFQPAQVSCDVTKDQRQVTNNSDIPVYLRVTITANFEKTEEGETVIHWQNPTLTVDPGNNWVKVGDFYYFKGTVAPDAAVNLPGIEVSGTVSDYSATTHVLAEVIQSDPDDAVRNAWNMTYNGSAWSIYNPEQ